MAMEFIKTQLQLGRSASAALPYNSVFGGISHTVRTTGFLSLYNGLAPNLLGAMPKAGLRFGVAGHVRESLKDPQTGRISPWANLLGGLIAGATEATLVVTPVETVSQDKMHSNECSVYRWGQRNCKGVRSGRVISRPRPDCHEAVVKPGTQIHDLQRVQVLAHGRTRH